MTNAHRRLAALAGLTILTAAAITASEPAGPSRRVPSADGGASERRGSGSASATGAFAEGQEYGGTAAGGPAAGPSERREGSGGWGVSGNDPAAGSGAAIHGGTPAGAIIADRGPSISNGQPSTGAEGPSRRPSAGAGTQLPSRRPTVAGGQRPNGTQLPAHRPTAADGQRSNGAELPVPRPSTGSGRSPNGTQLPTRRPSAVGRQTPSSTQLPAHRPTAAGGQTPNGTQLPAHRPSTDSAQTGPPVSEGQPSAGAELPSRRPSADGGLAATGAERSDRGPSVGSAAASARARPADRFPGAGDRTSAGGGASAQGGASDGGEALAYAGEVSILTFNVCGGACRRGEVAGTAGFVARTARQRNASVVLLQELCFGQFARIRSLLPGYSASFARTTSSAGCAVHDPLQSGFGVAVFVRGASTERVTQTLPTRQGAEKRVLLGVTAMVGGRPTSVAVVHLSPSRADGLDAQLAAVSRYAARRAGRPLIIGGDFNALPGNPGLGRLYSPAAGGTGRLLEADELHAGVLERGGAATFDTAGRKIDYIFLSQGWFSRPRATSSTTSMSDHHVYLGRAAVISPS